MEVEEQWGSGLQELLQESFQLSFLFLLFLAHLFPALSYTGLEPRRSSLRPGELEVWGVAL